MAGNVANSTTDIVKIAQAMNTSQQNISTIVTSLNAYAASIASLSSINVGDLKAGANNITALYSNMMSVVSKIANFDIKKLKSIKNTGKAVSDAMKDICGAISASMEEFQRLSNTLSSFDHKALIETLVKSETAEKITDASNTDSSQTSYTIENSATKGGLLDAMLQLFELYKNLGDAKRMGIVKRSMFKFAFKGMLNDFNWVITEMMTRLTVADMGELNKTVSIAAKISTVLPGVMSDLMSAFILSKSKRRGIKRGIQMFIGGGKDTEDSKTVMGAIGQIAQSLAKIQNEHGPNIQKASTSIEKLMNTMNLTMISLAMFGLLGIPAILGTLAALLVIKLLTRMLNTLGKINNKDTSNATKNIIGISMSILLLSSAVAVIALTGQLIYEAWPLITITMLFITGLVMVIGIFGSKFLKSTITDGSKTILMIGLAVLALTMTTMLIVLLGDHINASWEQIAIVGVALLGMVAMFALVGLASRLIQDGTKSILMIAIAVAILSVVAVGIVAVSKVLDGDMTQVLLVIGVVLALSYSFKIISKSAKKIKINEIIKLTLVAALCTGMIWILGDVANKTDGGDLLGTVAIMLGVVLAIIGIATLLSTPPVPAIITAAMAPLAMAAGIILAVSGAMWLIADAMEKMQDIDEETTKKTLMLPVSVISEVCTGLKDISLIELLKASTKLISITGISLAIGTMATVLKSIASLSIPTEYDKDGKPIDFVKMTDKDFTQASSNASLIGKLFMAMCSEGDGETVDVNGYTIYRIPFKNAEKISYGAKKGFQRLTVITQAIGNMANVIRDIAALNIPTQFDNNGKVVKWESMNDGHFKLASENAAKIASSIIGIFSKDANGNSLLDTLDEIDEDNAEVLGLLLNSVGNISNVMNVITTLASGKIPMKSEDKNGKIVIGDPIDISTIDFGNISKHISTILSTVITGVINIDESLIDDAEDVIDNVDKVIKSAIDSTSSVIDLYKNSLKDIDVDDLGNKYNGATNALTGIIDTLASKRFSADAAKNFKSQADSLVQILKQTNDTDLGKLKYAFSLVSKMAEFSKSIRGDFDKLAKCLSEDLLEALEKLNGSLEGINENTGAVSLNTAALLPSNSGTGPDKSTPAKLSNTEDALRREIAALKSQVEALQNQQKPQHIKTDPSSGAVIVKIL